MKEGPPLPPLPPLPLAAVVVVVVDGETPFLTVRSLEKERPRRISIIIMDDDDDEDDT